MKLRRTFIIAIAFIFVSLFTLSFKVSANTVETSELIIVEGAQIRTSGNAGIRFVAKEEYAGTNETAYGIILAFGEAEANEEFVIDGTVNGKAVLKGEVQSTHSGVYTATLYNVPEEFYEQKVTARAYVVDGDKVVYSQTVATRSLAEVALAAKTDGDDSEFVKNICDSVNSSTFDYGAGAFTTTYGFYIKAFNSDVSGDNVTLATKAKVTSASGTWWVRVLLVESEIPGLFKIADVVPANGKSISATSSAEYDYVIGLHSNCTDATSKSNINKLVALENVKDYYLAIEVPNADGACNIKVDVDTNPTYLSGSKFLLEEGQALPNAYRQYYTFAGWCDNAELTGEVTKTHNGAKKYYAKYTPVEYTITYHLNDGTTTAKLVESYNIESAAIQLPAASTMSIADGEFLSWHLDANCTTEAITEIPTGSHGNINVYANWKLNTITTVELSAADETAIDALTPTVVVSADFNGGKYLVDGVEYVYGETAFANLSAALANVSADSKIYVFAGTYSEALTVDKANIVIYGPNYNISYKNTRNTEAIISGKITLSAGGFELNGINFTGSAIQLANGSTIDGVKIKNVIAKSTTVSTDGGRSGVIVSDTAVVSNLEVTDSSFTITGGAGKNIFAMYGPTTNATIQNSKFDNGGTSNTISELARLNDVRGTVIYSNNESLWATKNYTLYIRPLMTKDATITVQDNKFDGGAAGSGFYFPNQTANSSVTFIGNEVYGVKGNTFSFADCQAGSKQNIMYNYFDANTAFKLTTKGSGTNIFTNNYYAASQTTTTSDYGVITSLEALQAAYAAYKAQ